MSINLLDAAVRHLFKSVCQSEVGYIADSRKLIPVRKFFKLDFSGYKVFIQIFAFLDFCNVNSLKLTGTDG